MVEEVNSHMRYLIHCKNLCKCHNVPSPVTTIKETKELYVFLENLDFYYYIMFYLTLKTFLALMAALYEVNKVIATFF
jgi:hypothetical protein